MGVTVVSATVQSNTIGNDDDVDIEADNGAGIQTVTFNSMGTSPILRSIEGGESRGKIKFTSGSGSPAIAANNLVITFPGGRTPRKVLVGSSSFAAGWHVASVAAGSVSIGTKVAPAASTAYDLDVIILF